MQDEMEIVYMRGDATYSDFSDEMDIQELTSLDLQVEEPQA